MAYRLCRYVHEQFKACLEPDMTEFVAAMDRKMQQQRPRFFAIEVPSLSIFSVMFFWNLRAARMNTVHIFSLSISMRIFNCRTT